MDHIRDTEQESSMVAAF